MLKEEKLPKEMLIDLGKERDSEECEVKKTALKGIDELQCLEVNPYTIIRTHEHTTQWEVWLWPSRGLACICPKGDKHSLVNNSNKKINIIAIKGRTNYSYEELAKAFSNLGFRVERGDLQN